MRLFTCFGALSLFQFAVGEPAVVELRQADFDKGTLIIDQPGYYKFMEDIEFRPQGDLDPSQPESWMFPNITTAPYNDSAYRLGFFAGLVISAPDVTLDLNGKLFEQSKEHAIMQRFYALIELASSPFPANAGPAAFATQVKSATNVVIKNGKLGRSAHHGIHGNGNKGVTLQDLEIVDFEVAGVHLNAVDDLVIENVVVKNTRTDVPADGRLSNAIFLLQGISKHLTIDTSLTEGTQVLGAMQTLREVVFKFLDFYQTQGTPPALSDAPNGGPIFASETGGIPDASLTAGIVVHSKFSVGDFQSAKPRDFSENVVLKNVQVSNITVSPREKGTLFSVQFDENTQDAGNTYTGPAHVHDMVGAVFDTDFVTNVDTHIYSGNALTDLQVAVARYHHKCFDTLCASFNETKQKNLLKRNTINKKVVAWADGTLSWDDLMVDYKVVGNHDLMHHRVKGVVGVKLDGVSKVRADKVMVRNIQNLATGDRRSPLAQEYDPHYAYNGYEVRGVSVAAGVDVDLSRIGVVNAESSQNDHGVYVRGIDLLGEWKDIVLKQTVTFLSSSDITTALGEIEQVFKVDEEEKSETNVALYLGIAFGAVSLVLGGTVLYLNNQLRKTQQQDVKSGLIASPATTA
jgi:hypothetical protein